MCNSHAGTSFVIGQVRYRTDVEFRRSGKVPCLLTLRNGFYALHRNQRCENSSCAPP